MCTAYYRLLLPRLPHRREQVRDLLYFTSFHAVFQTKDIVSSSVLIESASRLVSSMTATKPFFIISRTLFVVLLASSQF